MAKQPDNKPICSMTAFARQAGGLEALTWTWEIKSVNAKGLDPRARLPQGLEALDAQIRQRLPKRLARGSLQINLVLDRSAQEQEVRLNEAVLTQLLAEGKRLEQEQGLAPASVDGLLAIKGVVEVLDPVEDEAAKEAREAALLEDFDKAVDQLIAARRAEGEHLLGVINSQLEELLRLTQEAGDLASTQPEALKQRLTAQLAELLGEDSGVAPERLAQEVALLSAKADVREELDRLAGHIAALSDLLEAGGPVGRRLDFLCQELNREANTLCSKSADMDLTRLGLALKATIDQLREQVQNIE
ncbi:MAG: YicC family protein [Limibacillus sp.]